MHSTVAKPHLPAHFPQDGHHQLQRRMPVTVNHHCLLVIGGNDSTLTCTVYVATIPRYTVT